MSFARTRDHMQRALTEGIFTGAVLRVSQNGKPLFHESYGTLGGPGTAPVTTATLFDLASLTKVLVTTPAWLLLAARNPAILDRPLSAWFPNAPADKSIITPRQLLAHASGLPAWRPYYLFSSNWSVAKLVSERILHVDLDYPVGQGFIYSDLGFILLAALAENETSTPPGKLVRDQVFIPLGVADDLLFTPSKEKHRTALTRAGEEPGLVHDLNARSLGGIAGHAGLFGTAEAVAITAEEILNSLNSKGKVFDPQTVKTFCRKTEFTPDSTRTLGFDTPSKEGSSSGKYFSLESLGHTGFTGTSLWMDPTKGILVVLLTNRVFMGESNMRIKTFRPEIHDVVMEDIAECLKRTDAKASETPYRSLENPKVSDESPLR